LNAPNKLECFHKQISNSSPGSKARLLGTPAIQIEVRLRIPPGWGDVFRGAENIEESNQIEQLSKAGKAEAGANFGDSMETHFPSLGGGGPGGGGGDSPKKDSKKEDSSASETTASQPASASLQKVLYAKDKQAIMQGLKRFADAENLWASKKLIKFAECKKFPAEVNAHFGKNGGLNSNGNPVTVENLTRFVADKCKLCHKVTKVSVLAAAAGDSGGQISYRQGPPPKVMIRTEKRKNHNITLIYGVDKYGYELSKLSEYFKAKVGSGCGIEDVVESMTKGKDKKVLRAKNEAKNDADGKDGGSGGNKGGGNSGGTNTKDEKLQLVIQGFWDKAAEEAFVNELGIPVEAIDNQALGKKKDMQQKKK
jgi:translation initiation factor 1 (eIF-1/SUI1)